MWKTFTGFTTNNLNDIRTITHGITNGRRRIVSVIVNVQTDDPEITGVPAQSFIAGGGNMQDEKDPEQEYQTYYDDTNIYLHIDGDATAINNKRYTIIVTYASTNLY